MIDIMVDNNNDSKSNSTTTRIETVKRDYLKT